MPSNTPWFILFMRWMSLFNAIFISLFMVIHKFNWIVPLCKIVNFLCFFVFVPGISHPSTAFYSQYFWLSRLSTLHIDRHPVFLILTPSKNKIIFFIDNTDEIKKQIKKIHKRKKAKMPIFDQFPIFSYMHISVDLVVKVWRS